MDRVLLDCIILTVAASAVLGVGAYVFGNSLLGIYTADEEVIQCGLEILSITTVPYFLCGIMDLLPGALREWVIQRSPWYCQLSERWEPESCGFMDFSRRTEAFTFCSFPIRRPGFSRL